MVTGFARATVVVSIAVIASVVAVGGVAFAVTGSRPVAVAIGDSIMEGHGLQADQAWPQLLASENHWKLTNLASDGSGFVKVGNAGDVFADQAKAAIALHPSIVILAGSSNDLGESDAALAAATGTTIAMIRAALPTAKIIAIDAIWGASALPAQLNDIDNQVETAIAAVGGEYVDIGQPMSGHPELMQAGDVHPTAAGQRLIASAVAAKL